MGRRIPLPMTKYLYRTCPKCKDYLGVVVRDPPESKREVPIDAHCVLYGFNLGWKLVLGNLGLEREAREQRRGLWDKSP